MITSSDPRVTYSDLQWPTVTYSDPKVTYIDSSSSYLYLPHLTHTWRLRDLRWVEGGGSNQI